MRLIRPDLMQEVLADVGRCADWPYVASFVQVGGAVNAICIGSIGRYWHYGLYEFIRDQEDAIAIDAYDREINFGMIAWESMDEISIRTTDGHRLPESIELSILQTLAGGSK